MRLASRSSSAAEIDAAIDDYQHAYQRAMESQIRFHQAEKRCLIIIALALAFGWIPELIWKMWRER